MASMRSLRVRILAALALWAVAARGFGGVARPRVGLRALRAVKNEGSYYKRPAKALEKGGGFFIPGLKEQYKLKGFVAALVGTALVVNRFPGYTPPTSQLQSEAIGAFCVALLALQSALEALEARGSAEREAAAGEEVIVGGWLGGGGDSSLRSLVPWAAATLQLAEESICAVGFGEGAALRHLAGTYPAASPVVATLERGDAAPELAAAVAAVDWEGTAPSGLTLTTVELTPALRALVPPATQSLVTAQYPRPGGEELRWLVGFRSEEAPLPAVEAVLEGVVLDMDM